MDTGNGSTTAEGVSPRVVRPAVTSQWIPGDVSQDAKLTELDEELFERVTAAVKPGDQIATLSDKRPNKIVSIDRFGIAVETLRSDQLGSGPQMVSA
jgi:hypothetical protein